MKSTIPKSLLLFLCTLVLAPGLAAQDTASLTGTIRDQTGAVLSGAGVVLVNAANGLTRNLVTNSDGEYVAAALPPGRYVFTVTAPGFRTYKAEGVILRVAQNARIDVNMRVGSVNSEITVQGEGLAQVDTQSSELSGTVTGKEMVQLPLNGRNFTQLVTLVPGVSNQTGQDEGAVGGNGSIAYSFNGGRTEYNNWEIDGGANMDNGANASINVYPSLDAIAEVQVMTSNYGAQYGGSGSGMVEVETKSGTNDFHGSVYEFWRNELFNAHNYFDVPGTPKAGYKKHDFGYSLGGPIWKNHTFFFWSQEFRREVVPFNFFSQVPSLANRQGNFNDQCNIPDPTDCPFDPNTGTAFPNNQIPFIDPNAKALLPMIPEPNLGSGVNSVFAAAIPQPTHWHEELVRIDHDFNSKLRATFRAIHDSWDTTNAGVTWAGENFPTIRTHFTSPGVGLVARLTATVSSTSLNELVAGYTTNHIHQNNTNPAVWTRGPGFTMTGLFPNFQGKLPDFCLNTAGAYGGGFCEGPTAFPWENSNPTYTVRDNLSKSWGKHKLVMGGYFVDAEKNEFAYTDLEGDLVFDSSVPVSTGNAFADMLMGNIASYTQANAQPKYHFNYKIFEPYIQDDFHVSKNLTLNLGFRLSLFGTFWEKHHLVGNWDPAAYNPKTAPLIDVDGSVTGLAGALIPTPGTNLFDGIVQCGVGGVPRGCLKGHLFNPAPRVGFAWDPTGTGKMSVRAGYGVFFEHTNGMEVNAEDEENTPPAVEQPTQYNVVGYTNIGGQGILFPQAQVSIPDKAIWPYVQQWHLDVQRDLIKHAVATISYVGSKGTHLTLQHELNQLRPTPASQNPFNAGQPITDDVCGNQGGSATAPTFVVNGNTVTNQAAINLAVACGNNPDPFRPYYGVGSVERFEAVANSNYNALQFSLNKNTGALTLDVAYTYSHSLDDSSDAWDANFVNSYDVRKNYASSNFDQRHILTVAWIYALPSLKGSRLVHALLGGWQYAGIMTSESGTPFAVDNGGFGDNAGVADGVVNNGSFADIVGNPFHVPPRDPNQKGPLLFNPNAFIQPQGLTFGDSGRNSLNLPHRTNFDMAVYKVFKPTEKVDVQFRAEAFNIFNHPQWANINQYVGASNFLYPSQAHMPRVGQFAIRISF
ncbi:MAG TPA: carboxypeptidase regulatory-like domain-containing protein [Terriglobales bacterium]|nr:carboxypeptidase regulatory-like domain-containing protein [Terriglobales bacterium]